MVAYSQLKIEDEDMMLNKLQRRNRQLAQLNEASQQLTATLESDKVMIRMLQIATEIVAAQDASVWTWEDESEDYLICRATSNEALFAELRKLRVRRGEGIVGAVADHGQADIVVDAQTDARFFDSADLQTGFQTHTLLSVPLIVRDNVLGVLQMLNKPTSFEEEDVTLAETLAVSAAIALDNARLVEQLQQQKHELEIRNADLDAFARTVAHDLKTPLNWVSGYLELLVKDWDRLSAEDRVEYAANSQNGAQMMSNIIDELLLLASLRETEVELGHINMRAVMHNVEKRIEPLIKQHNATLHVVEPLENAFGYSPWIEGVWVNYISNALKYGGTPPVVEVGSRVEPNETVYWVRDNGAGLSAEQREKLFVPFTRLEQRRARGHGLGLSIVQRIIAKLGGRVGLNSHEGEGSCFYFTLPKRIS